MNPISLMAWILQLFYLRLSFKNKYICLKMDGQEKMKKILIIIAALFLLTIPCNSHAAAPEYTIKYIKC